MSLWTSLGLPEPIAEYKFSPLRKWRFDYAWPEWRVAVEIEGGIWTYGAHVRGGHYLSDMEKYNDAALRGWRVFRFTPQQMKKGIVQSYLLDLWKMEGHSNA